MRPLDQRHLIIAAATPIFACRGFHGTNVRAIAKAAGVNLSMISYHFGGKEGLYAAVLAEQFAGLARIAAVADSEIDVAEKFATYLYECGVCFHCGTVEEFTPRTASADRAVPECPHCLANDAAVFTVVDSRERKAS